MTTRTYQRNGSMVSLLGFGCMRLPRLYPDKQDIDYDKAQEMIDYAYSHGVNYYDTAYVYHEGKSEVFIGEALKKYPRESFYLADKMPGWAIQNGADGAKKIFEEQLSRCQVNYFDFYLLHSLGDRKNYETTYAESGVLTYLDGEKAAGRIRNLGFSFHGSVDFFAYLMEQRKWDFAQIQLNYLDWEGQNAKKLYELAEQYGVQLIIMEPVRGGSLVSLCDESIEILKKAKPDKSAASWAIRFAATPADVLCVLSGMTTMEHVTDNVATIENFIPLEDDEYAVLSEAVAAYLNKGTISCTGCRYCMECPSGVDIPGIFAVYNKCAASGNLPVSLRQNDSAYQKKLRAFQEAFESIPASARPDQCISCGKCVEHCPQSIKIPERMKEIAGRLK